MIKATSKFICNIDDIEDLLSIQVLLISEYGACIEYMKAYDTEGSIVAGMKSLWVDKSNSKWVQCLEAFWKRYTQCVPEKYDTLSKKKYT